MTRRLTTNYVKNYCNRTLIVEVIVENVVTCFLGHGVYPEFALPNYSTLSFFGIYGPKFIKFSTPVKHLRDYLP